MVLKELVRPPFANYDVVVYFGCGLFFVPFLNRYIVEPFQLGWPTFRILGTQSVTTEIISALSLLMFVYIIGHMLAYLSSQIIEKAIDTFLGKVSTAIVFLTIGRAGTRNAKIRKHIVHRFRSISKNRAIPASVFRGLFHLPAIPSYLVTAFFGIFGYFNSRLSIHVVVALSRKIKKLGIPRLRLVQMFPGTSQSNTMS